MSHEHSPLTVAAATAAAFAAGAFLAAQSRINGELGARLDDGFVAALISFVTGVVLMGLVMLIVPSGRRGAARLAAAVREQRMPWWLLPAGTIGAFAVSMQGLTVAALGVALFTVATVCGQIISAMIIDRRGFGTMTPRAVTVTRVVGSAVALVAVVWSVSSRVQSDVPLWMLVLPFLAGLLIGWQQAANGQIREFSGSAITTTFLNFLVGTLVLLVVVAVHIAISGAPTRPLPTEPWLYLGGPTGIMLVGLGAVVVPLVGVLVAGLATIAGQLVVSLLLDLLLPTAGHTVQASTVIGAVLTFGAAVLVALPPRRGRAAVSPRDPIA